MRKRGSSSVCELRQTRSVWCQYSGCVFYCVAFTGRGGLPVICWISWVIHRFGETHQFCARLALISLTISLAERPSANKSLTWAYCCSLSASRARRFRSASPKALGDAEILSQLGDHSRTEVNGLLGEDDSDCLFYLSRLLEVILLRASVQFVPGLEWSAIWQITEEQKYSSPNYRMVKI